MKTLILFIIFFLFFACNEQNNSTSRNQVVGYKKLDEKKKLWRTSKIKDYSFVAKRSCFCLYQENKFIKVSNGKITEAKYIPSNTPLEEKQKIIEDYFNIIKDALDRNASILKVTYDNSYGFPSSIYIDYDNEVADEEISYTLMHFQKGNTICTEKYAPVCAEVNVQCVTTPCESIEQTFSNKCYLNTNPNATYLRDGEC